MEARCRPTQEKTGAEIRVSLGYVWCCGPLDAGQNLRYHQINKIAMVETKDW
jgi:hypothetical protein